jgi:cyclopropane fatty-acyl-phospholipid synthase-like methyltransferase
MHEYGEDFYKFLSSFAVRSAEQVVPVVMGAMPVTSIADFGCGQGAWLSVWKAAGATVAGVDGPYVDQARLLIAPEEFTAADLTQKIDLGRRFDLVQSVEVAEHLPIGKAEAFIDTLVAHADAVLFSAAVPGQGGEHHVNEQKLAYWRAIFRARGYMPVDVVRPAVKDNSAVQRWYRCNTVLYVRNDRMDMLSAWARALVVPDGESLAEYWPFGERVKQSILSRVPVAVVDRLARMNAAMLAKRAVSRSR